MKHEVVVPLSGIIENYRGSKEYAKATLPIMPPFMGNDEM